MTNSGVQKNSMWSGANLTNTFICQWLTVTLIKL